MTGEDQLAARFEEHRSHLRAVAYRMLGSTAEADDAVQEAWLRVSRADATTVDNLGGWLTTVVARVCLNLLRSRRTRREEPMPARLPEPVVTPAGGDDPEHELLLADAVGLAMLVVLDTLNPAERVAFVLHDVFGLPFAEIAPILERSPAATRQLASRARRRVRGTAPTPDRDLAAQRRVVDAFLAAARTGDLDALLSVLAPDVVVRSDFGAGARATGETRGARAVAAQAMSFANLAPFARAVLVNGAAGLLVLRDGRPFAILGFTVRDGAVAELDVFADPARLARLRLPGVAAP